MANTIRIKRRASGGIGAPGTLENAELAFNEVDNTLYYGKGSGGAGGSASSVIAIAGDGAFFTLNTAQTVSAVKTFAVSPIVPTAAPGTSNTQAASTAFVQAAVTAGSVSDGDKGDITVSGGGAAWTIDPGVVTNSKLAIMGANTFKGRLTSAGDPQDLTVAQVKSALALNNVDNTSDANKPISTATQTALNAKVNTSAIGAANGVAPLGADSKIPSAFLPSYVDDVLEFANLAAFPTTGESGVMYVALDTGFLYRWGGSAYVRIAGSPGTTDDVPEGSVNLYFTDARARAAVITQAITSGLTTAAPSSGAVFTALAGKQNLNSTLTALGNLTTAANQGIYATGLDAFATYSLTAGGRALAGVAGTANTFPYFSAANVVTLGSITAAGRALIDDASAADQRTTLGATTAGANIFTMANPSAISFLRINADNTVTARSAAELRTDIGAGTGNGTVTSVQASGGSTGLTFTGGPVTSTGTLTLAGTLALANGGTGATTAAGARTSLGLGTMATQNANAVAITGGSIDNITIDGGVF